MGRRKITIRQIVDPKLRHITFNKRKNGLIKKAAELSLLCNINMLLIFEDGNGNLIQFSKNKLVNIPSFFQECRYSNVLEFNAKDYPHFFKVNHYKKHKDRDQDDYDNDDLEITGEMNPKMSSLGHSGLQSKLLSKRERIHGPGHIKEEDRDSSKIIYQSGSDEESSDEAGDGSPYSERQAKEAMIAQKKKSQLKPKPRLLVKPDEKQKAVINEEEPIVPPTIEQEAPSNQKETFQAYKEAPQRIRGEKPVDYAAQFMGFEHPFKRNTPANEPPANSPFRFYPTDNTNPNSQAANAYVSNSNYVNSHPYIHNNHGYPAAPSPYPNNKQNNRLRGFGNMNMGNIQNEEAQALNAMFKGFPPLGFAMGGGPFMPQPNSKPEMDEKLLDTAKMIKYLNGTGANFSGQKIYNFHPADTGKAEDADHMGHLRNRNDHEGVSYDHEHEYHDLPPYVRGDFRIDGNLPSNLPSAYFSSKKFNFDGYFNTFEDDRFNEFGDPKKKLKQG